MTALIYLGLFAFFAFLILKGGFELIAIAFGSEGLEGIVAFWIGAAILFGIGMFFGIW
jgi:hypothetical protein